MAKNRTLNHVAIIMDGNGRWAQKRGLKRIEGHKAGSQNVKKIAKECIKLNIKFLTLYAFSTENWKRPKTEVTGLMKILSNFIRTEKDEFLKNGIRLLVSGEIERLPQYLKKDINSLINESAKNKKLIINIALNYGSRLEILNAVKNIAMDVKRNKLSIKNISENIFKKYLYNGDILPDPDLLIRTSGELRISNFLLWQLAYSELYFTKTFWPDFSPAKFRKAVENFLNRNRRFGGLKDN